jgi:RNA polymerase-interacting CarD/CdnL/TRCF family regulator
MEYREGDFVMHWVYGLGQVVQLEERDLSGTKTMYYVIKIGDMTIWVPTDERSDSSLRRPTREEEFAELKEILAGPGEPLPDDRHLRKTMLLDWLKNGRAESLCQVISSLATYRQRHSLNDNDQVVLKRVQKALAGEWSFAYSISPEQANVDMHNLLRTTAVGV